MWISQVECGFLIAKFLFSHASPILPRLPSLVSIPWWERPGNNRGLVAAKSRPAGCPSPHKSFCGDHGERNRLASFLGPWKSALWGKSFWLRYCRKAGRPQSFVFHTPEAERRNRRTHAALRPSRRPGLTRPSHVFRYVIERFSGCFIVTRMCPGRPAHGPSGRSFRFPNSRMNWSPFDVGTAAHGFTLGVPNHRDTIEIQNRKRFAPPIVAMGLGEQVFSPRPNQKATSR